MSETAPATAAPAASAPAASAASPGAGGALAVFDLDGTITRFDTLGPFLAACLARWPWRLPRLLGTLPALLRYALADHDRGALKGALLHAALGGLTREQLQPVTERFIARLLRHGLHRQALPTIQAHRQRGERLVLMSASPDLYLPQLAAALGFQATLCSPVRWRADGRLDGRLAAANCRGAEKQRQLLALLERERPAHVYAYGNSRADLPHMQLAQDAYLVNGPRHLGAAGHGRIQRLRWTR